MRLEKEERMRTGFVLNSIIPSIVIARGEIEGLRMRERERERAIKYSTTDYSSCVYVHDSEREGEREGGRHRRGESKRENMWLWEAGGGNIERFG